MLYANFLELSRRVIFPLNKCLKKIPFAILRRTGSLIFITKIEQRL